MLTLLILKLLQSPVFPLRASTQHLNNKRNVPTTTIIFLFRLNYLTRISSLGQSLAKCPAYLQRKHITSVESRGFLVII